MKSIFNFFVVIVISIFLISGTDKTPNQNTQKEVIAYYTGGANEIDDFPVEHLTQVIYSFLRLKGNRLLVTDERAEQALTKLADLKKKYPQLKVLVALGGWGGCETCSDIFSSEKNRKAFAKSVKKLLYIYGIDGIDLDWEYPAIQGMPGHAFKPEDKQNFTALVKELRAQLGNEAIISFAAGVSLDFFEKSIEWKKVMPMVNHVNLMTYDLVNGYSKTTGHHASLFSTIEQNFSAEFAVEYLKNLGIPTSKMVIGGAFYARVWGNVNAENNGLYQSGNHQASVKYSELESYLNKGFELYWDSIAQAPFAYNQKDKVFATYDDKQSIAKKVEYVKKEGLKGIMFWELMNDKAQNGLVEAINKSIK